MTSEQKFPEFVQSEITLVLNWSHHGDIVECYVKDNPSWELPSEWSQPTEKNVEDSAKSNGKLLSERVQLNIRFAPIFIQPARRLNWPIEKHHGSSTDQRLIQYIVVEGKISFMEFPTTDDSKNVIVAFLGFLEYNLFLDSNCTVGLEAMRVLQAMYLYVR